MMSTAGEPRFKLHCAAEALLPQPPIAWIVEPLFSEGTVSLVVGDPGSKKTYSLLDMGVCVALGKPWLQFATRKSPVLLIDEESGGHRINRRLGDIMRAHSADEDIDFRYVSLARLDLTEPVDVEALESLVLQTQSKMVIIDALADIMPGADENSVMDVQPVFLALRGIAERAGCAITLIHHSNKNGGYRGSTALLGAADVMLKVESKPDSSNVDFRLEKNRDGEAFAFDAVADFLPGELHLSGGAVHRQVIPAARMPSAQSFVLQYLSAHGASLATAICANAEPGDAGATHKAIYALAKQELVHRVDEGGPGKPATFELTNKGRLVLVPPV